MIDLEDASSLDARNPKSTAVEAGPQDDHLLDAVSQGSTERVIDEAGPGNPRRPRPGPPGVDQAGNEIAPEWEPGQEEYEL